MTKVAGEVVGHPSNTQLMVDPGCLACFGRHLATLIKMKVKF